MKREIMKRLEMWKKDKDKKILIIKGARQVGKTYVAREFIRNNYKHIVEINFERDQEYVSLFKRTHNPFDILSYLQLSFIDVEFNNDTCLFLDEIQACSDALTALKFLSEDFPCDIICSGSMLGIAIATSSSFPVGYVETWELYPMSFKEFLMAMGVSDHIIDSLNNYAREYKSIPEVIHHKLNDLFISYMIVGGMPEVIAKYVETRSYRDTLTIQRRIVNDYLNDMAKYGVGGERIKARECFSSIPLQLAKENKKFQYKLIKNGASARGYKASLRWLDDSGLIIPVHRLHAIEKPLEAYKELSIFKVYMADTGLLISQFDEAIIKDLMTGQLGVFKGALIENMTAEILHAKEKKCYYFQPSTTSEIDFVIYYQGEITPIEVKGGHHTKSISLNHFVSRYHSQYAFRCSIKNIGETSDNIKYIPLYLLEFILDNEEKII